MIQKNLDYYLGNIEQPYLGYAAEGNIRRNAASGGMVSAVLLHLLRKKEIGGALVCRQKKTKGKIDAKVFIAKTPKDILSCQSSIYFYIPILSNLKKIKEFPAKLAVVGLPCQIKTMRNLMKNNPDLESKLFLIGLFCGHVSKKDLLIKILNQKGIEEKEVKKVIFRRGHWRGKMHIFLENQTTIIFPFEHFSTYQNLFFYTEKTCLSCTDQTSKLADISAGDVWSYKFKKNPIKHSLVLARNKKAKKILEKMEQEGRVNLENITQKDVFDIQKRSLIFHRHIKARGIVGKLFGLRINYSKGEIARWNDYLAALMILLNVKLSESRIGAKIIFAVPRKIWFLYLILFKLLTSF